MFSDKSTATKILPHLEESIKNLTEAIKVAAELAPKEESEQFKKQAGILLGNIDYELIYPIHHKHPELDNTGKK